MQKSRTHCTVVRAKVQSAAEVSLVVLSGVSDYLTPSVTLSFSVVNPALWKQFMMVVGKTLFQAVSSMHTASKSETLNSSLAPELT